MLDLGWLTQDNVKMCVTRCENGGAGIAIYFEANNNCKCCDTSASLSEHSGANAYQVGGKMFL